MRIQFDCTAESARLDLYLSQYLLTHRVSLRHTAFPRWRRAACAGVPPISQPVYPATMALPEHPIRKFLAAIASKKELPMSNPRPARNLRSGLSLLFLLAVLAATSACNTWRGAGRDVERTGEKMQEK